MNQSNKIFVRSLSFLKSFTKLSAVGAICGFASVVDGATIEYQELFGYDLSLPDPTGLGEQTNPYGWRWAGYDGTFRNGSVSGQTAISAANGAAAPSGGSVNSSPLVPDTSQPGYVFSSNTNNDATILFTNEHRLSLDSVSDYDFSWQFRNDSANQEYRALIAVGADTLGDAWFYTQVQFFVSDPVTSTGNNSVNWDGNINFDLGATDWYALTVANGTPITVAGSSSTLPSSASGEEIVGFGLMMDDRAGGNNRIDNFAVAIPEAATGGLLLGALAAGSVLLRRRASGSD